MTRPAFEVRHDPATGRFLPKGDAGGQPGEKAQGIGVTSDQRSLVQKVNGKLPGESDVAYHDRVFTDGQERYAPVDDIEQECVEIRADEGVPQVEFKDWTSIEAPYERLVETGDAFDAAKSDPNDPRVKAAYADLVAQTNLQWDHLTGPVAEGGQGIKVDFLTREQIQALGDPLGLNPYQTAEAQAADLRDNNHLFTASISSYPEIAHPILDSSLGGEYDKLRAVHDAYGHAAIGADFSRHGEYQAWLHHSSMFTGGARLAASTELTGENSFLVTRGRSAPHKATLLPDNLVAMPWDRDGNYMPDFWKRKAMAARLLTRRRLALAVTTPADEPLLSDLVQFPVPDPATATGSDLARLDNAYARYGVVNPCDALHGAVLIERIQKGEVDPATLQAAIDAGLVAAAGDGISGAMVAAVPSAATAPEVDNLVGLAHVTLCYLGDDATAIADPQRALIDAFVALVAADEAPVTATVAGVGVLGAYNAVVLLLNSRLLYEAHDEIQCGLEAAGLCPPWSHDGFICHLSLEYPDDVPASILAAQHLVGTEIVFDALVTVYGGEERTFPLTGTPESDEEPTDVEMTVGPGVGLFTKRR